MDSSSLTLSTPPSRATNRSAFLIGPSASILSATAPASSASATPSFRVGSATTTIPTCACASASPTKPPNCAPPTMPRSGSWRNACSGPMRPFPREFGSCGGMSNKSSGRPRACCEPSSARFCSGPPSAKTSASPAARPTSPRRLWIVGTGSRRRLRRFNLGLIFQPELLDGHFPHSELLHLAGDGERKFLDELDVARNLEARDLVFAELANGILGQGRPAFQLDPRCHLLAIPAIGHANHLHCADPRAGIKKLLDLARRNIFTAADDDVLGASGDLEVAVLVHDGQITAMQPATAVDDGTGCRGVV